MKEWLEDFYTDPALRDTLLKSFLPVFSSYVAEATGGPVAASFVQSLAESYVDRHLGSSRAQLQEVVKGSADPLADLSARFDEWEEKRPGKVAANELVRSANAAAVQQMKERGVTKKVWASSGGACPFCSSLDGVIVEVDSFFLNEGDELNPEGAEAPMHFESSLGHPPIHQGCNCSVEAVFETESALSAEQREQEVWATDNSWEQLEGDRAFGIYGHKRGAAERAAQMRELDARGVYTRSAGLSQRPSELYALEGDMEKARAKWIVEWQRGSTNPPSALAARILSEDGVSGAVWANGRSLLEPSDAMKRLVADLQEQTQNTLTQDFYTLYRGVTSADGSGNVLESWTSDVNVARKFDGHAVYEAQVPRKRILADIGGVEAEMIVIGGSSDLKLRVVSGLGT